MNTPAAPFLLCFDVPTKRQTIKRNTILRKRDGAE